MTREENGCPGRFKCHGPASFCPECGDVDLICDDPRCDVHARGNERERDVKRLRMEFARTNDENESKRRELIAAVEKWERWRDGNPVMVARKETA